MSVTSFGPTLAPPSLRLARPSPFLPPPIVSWTDRSRSTNRPPARCVSVGSVDSSSCACAWLLPRACSVRPGTVLACLLMNLHALTVHAIRRKTVPDSTPRPRPWVHERTPNVSVVIRLNYSRRICKRPGVPFCYPACFVRVASL